MVRTAHGTPFPVRYTGVMNTRSSRLVVSLVLFVILLVVLNFFFDEWHIGVHISIIGSVLITLVIWVILAGMRQGAKQVRDKRDHSS